MPLGSSSGITSLALAFTLTLAACSPSGDVTGPGGGTTSSSSSGTGGASALVPTIDGPWWQIAANPDLGALSTPDQQPVDFSIWQAADGTWQLWSCVRGTNVGGNGRLFHGWEGQNLTDPDWTPKGIAMQADPTLGETVGGLQAPFVTRVAGVYHMFYGDWQNICHQTSQDGKTFTRVIQADGHTGMFTEGPGTNTRDPMVLPIGDTFFAYYTANPGSLGADYCRTSKDLVTWSAPTQVAFGGQAGTGPAAAECPFVIHRDDVKQYVLFRTQRYGADAQTSVYRSADPLDFGIDDDSHLVGTLPVAAPEIIDFQGQTYIASLLPSLGGVRVARLGWVSR